VRCSRRRASSPWCARLTTADLVQHNKAVELEGLTPEAAAARWSEDA
jgi:hypothetical protein